MFGIVFCDFRVLSIVVKKKKKILIKLREWFPSQLGVELILIISFHEYDLLFDTPE